MPTGVLGEICFVHWGFVNGPQCGFEFRGLLLQPVWRFTERRSTCRLSKLGRRLGADRGTEISTAFGIGKPSATPVISDAARLCHPDCCLLSQTIRSRTSSAKVVETCGEVRELSYFGGGYIGGADMDPIPSNLNLSPPATDRLRARPRAASAHTQL